MRRWLALILLCVPYGVAGAAVDLNTADQSVLESLDGIGPARARAIIEHRHANGPFRTLDEVLEVKGIGPKTLERIRPHIVIKPSAHNLLPGKRQRRAPAEQATP